MPKQQKAIPSDAARSILQHSMFGGLFVLILLNWRVHRPMDYAPFIKTFDVAENTQKKHSLSYLNGIFENYELEGGEERLKNYELALYINSQTDSIVKDLDILIDKYEDGNEENDLKVFDHIVALRDSLHFSYHLFSEFPFSDIDIVSFKELFHLRTSLLSYLPNNYRKVLLYSLRQDVLKARSIYNEFIYSNMHDQTLWFEGFRSQAILDSSSLFGREIHATIMLTKGLPLHRNGIYTADANLGLIDSIDEDDVFQWKSKASIIGLNTVTGSLRFKNRDTDVTHPFSFFYFVSAPGIAFHLDKANVCYVGVGNPISISVPGYAANKIKLRVAGAKVSKTGDSTFEVYFAKMPAGKVYAYVDATNAQGRTSTVHSMELKLQNLPGPVTNFEQYKDEGMDVASFFGQPRLKVLAADDAFSMEYEVLSFQVEGFTHDGKYIEPMTVYGDELSSNHELNAVFKTTASGDRFIFSNIKARGANGRVYEARPITVRLR